MQFFLLAKPQEFPVPSKLFQAETHCPRSGERPAAIQTGIWSLLGTALLHPPYNDRPHSRAPGRGRRLALAQGHLGGRAAPPPFGGGGGPRTAPLGVIEQLDGRDGPRRPARGGMGTIASPPPPGSESAAATNTNTAARTSAAAAAAAAAAATSSTPTPNSAPGRKVRKRRGRVVGPDQYDWCGHAARAQPDPRAVYRR